MDLNQRVAQEREQMIHHLQRLVGIKSVMNCGENGYPFGQGNHDCLEYCLNLGKSLGFTVKNMDEMCGYIEYGQGDKMIAVLTHLDVVPEGDGWNYDPYGAEIEENRMYGRGTLDDKGPAIASIFALKAIKESGIALTHRIRLIFGLNEENGSACIQHYVSAGEEFPIMGFTPDAAYPLINGEKGSYSATYGFQLKEDEPCRLVEFHAGTVMNVVPDYACGVLSLPQESCDFALKLDIENVKISPTEGGIKVEAFGRPAHAGNPGVGLNAIGLFYLALAQIPLQGELARLVEGMNKHFGIMVDGSGLGIATEDEVSGKLTVNVALGDLRDHVVTFTVNVRYPVTLTLESFQETLTNTMTQSGFTEKILAHKPPLYLPLESELVQKLCAVYQAQTSESAKPFCIGGATYAKELPNVVAFGPIFPGDESRIHRADEYIGLDSLLRHAQMNAAAMVELAR